MSNERRGRPDYRASLRWFRIRDSLAVARTERKTFLPVSEVRRRIIIETRVNWRSILSPPPPPDPVPRGTYPRSLAYSCSLVKSLRGSGNVSATVTTVDLIRKKKREKKKKIGEKNRCPADLQRGELRCVLKTFKNICACRRTGFHVREKFWNLMQMQSSSFERNWRYMWDM